MPREFRWRGQGAPPYRLVVLDESYEEVVAADAIRTRVCVPPAAIAAVLALGGTFHWYVEGEHRGQRTRSPLQSLEIR